MHDFFTFIYEQNKQKKNELEQEYLYIELNPPSITKQEDEIMRDEDNNVIIINIL